MNRIPPLVYVIIALILAAAIGWFAYNLQTNKTKTTTAEGTAVGVAGYSSVFLTNGQVYFGKVAGSTSDYLTLKDIYYLQVQQAIQPVDTKTTTTPPQISLVKLGDEIHGPKDEMKINKNQILFIEEIKEDGQVAKTIQAHKEGKTTPAAETTTTTSVKK